MISLLDLQANFIPFDLIRLDSRTKLNLCTRLLQERFDGTNKDLWKQINWKQKGVCCAASYPAGSI